MLETVFNASEAVLWLIFAVVVAVRYRRAEGGARRVARVMALFFVLFAGSDVIETETGAWWRPPGLLVLKGACLVGLTWCSVVLLRRERAGQLPPDGDIRR
jgi:hypothetical protein